MTFKHAARGGNSGFIKDNVVWGSDAASCLRKALLRARGVEEAISPKSRKVFAVGAINEEYFETLLKERGVRYTKEQEILEAVTDETNFCGHSDYIVEEDFGLCVYELKSVSSKNTYKKVFDKGELKLSNLAQCVNYMIAVETTFGRLRYTSYIEAVEYGDFDSLSLIDIMDAIREITPESRTFEINIDSKGKILVDSLDSGFTVQDVLEHRRQTALVLEKNRVFPDRPQGVEKFGSVCHFCPFRQVCDTWNGSRTTEQFINDCRDVVTTPKEASNGE